MARNYRKEYDEYHAKSEQKKRRAGRNKARRTLMRKGKVSNQDARPEQVALGDNETEIREPNTIGLP